MGNQNTRSTHQHHRLQQDQEPKQEQVEDQLPRQQTSTTKTITRTTTIGAGQKRSFDEMSQTNSSNTKDEENNENDAAIPLTDTTGRAATTNTSTTTNSHHHQQQQQEEEKEDENEDVFLESLHRDLNQVEQTMEEQPIQNSFFRWPASRLSRTHSNEDETANTTVNHTNPSSTTLTSTSTSTTSASSSIPNTNNANRNDTSSSGGGGAGGGGRAVFESLGSALGQIRRRFQEWQQEQQEQEEEEEEENSLPNSRHPGQNSRPAIAGRSENADSGVVAGEVSGSGTGPAEESPSHPSSSSSSSSSASSSNSSQFISSFSERLATVEQAHSTRMPLEMIRQRRQEQQTSEQEEKSGTDKKSGDDVEMSQGIGEKEQAASSSSSSSSSPSTSSSLSHPSNPIDRRQQAMLNKNNDNNSSDNDENQNQTENDNEDTKHRQTTRPGSTLVASRRYADAHETQDIAIHEGGALLVTSSLSSSSSSPSGTVLDDTNQNPIEDHEQQSSSRANAEQKVGQGNEEQNQKQQEDSYNENEGQDSNGDGDDNHNDRGIVLPSASLQNLDHQSHRGSLLLAASSISPSSRPSMHDREASSSTGAPISEANMNNDALQKQDEEYTSNTNIERANRTSTSTTMYCWGDSSNFHLGGPQTTNSTTNNSYAMNSIQTSSQKKADEEDKDVPMVIPIDSRVGRSDIVDISFGPSHAAIATSTGSLLICGKNDEGAVDPSQRSETYLPRPRHLESIMNMTTTRVLQVACGLDHTAILTESRSVLTFGNNMDGQLGHRPKVRRNPSNTDSGDGNSIDIQPNNCNDRRFQPPAAMVVPRRAAQIACGHRFTMVLTTRMEVFVCGREEITGYRSDVPTPNLSSASEIPDFLPQPQLPAQLPALQGLPLVHMAAGHTHAVVLTAQGTAYAWGANPTGACGRGFPKQLTVPVPIQVPNTTWKPSAVRISNNDSGLPLPPAPFVNWAAWEVETPNLITLAEDVAIVDVACGKDTTFLVTKTGQLLVAGSNDERQLGLPIDDGKEQNVFPAKTVDHPLKDAQFTSVAAGSHHALLLDNHGDVWKTGNKHSMKRVLAGKTIQRIAAGGTSSFALTCENQSVSSLNSQLVVAPGLDGLLDGITQEKELLKQQTCVRDLAEQTEELFRSPAVMNSVFLDPKEIDDLYNKLLMKTGEKKYRQQVIQAVEKGMIKGLEALKNARLMYPEAIRCLLLYLQCPLFRSSNDLHEDIVFDEKGEAILSLCEAILGLPFEGYKILISWSTSLYNNELFLPFLVQPLIDQLNSKIQTNRTRVVPAIVGVLKWFHNVSERFPDQVVASPESFYSTGVAGLPMEALFEDLIRFKRSTKSQRGANFFLCANPFLMSPSTKRNLLQVESQMTMVHAAQSGGVRFDMARRQFLFNPYFVMAVDRQYMLQQTLQAVANAAPRELRKSLKIVFKGEDGVDAGGVTKEFFQLLVVELFDINTGMWVTDFGDGLHTWFNSDCTWNQDGYYLVGILFGLALYNSVILDVHFPQAVYRKLLGLPLGLEDMVDPDVEKGLKQLLDYEGDDVEDVFCLTFEVTWRSLGMEHKKELKRNGANIPVTNENREEYVLLYVKWLLVDSVQSQYREFERGFMKVMEGASLEMLRPEELELLVVGTPELDFDALERTTEYEGGYDKDSPVVKNLWKFVKNASRETQLKFLKFSTGTTKAPIGGLAEMPFKIQRAGPDSLQLPTSHTCFNTLLVPDYGENYEKLEERLGRAVLECEGFGLQ